MRFVESIHAVGAFLRLAGRRLVRTPRYSGAFVFSLAFGIGANLAFLDGVKRFLLASPPHIGDPERIMRLYYQRSQRTPIGGPERVTSYPLFRALCTTWEPGTARVAAYSTREVSILVADRTVPVRAAITTGDYFPVLGMKPLRGAFFTANQPCGESFKADVVISLPFWRGYFGSDPGVIGRVLRIGDRDYSVIGVAPRGFGGLDFLPVSLWLPLGSTAEVLLGPDWQHHRGRYFLRVFARLKAGVGFQQAQNAFTDIHNRESNAAIPTQVLGGSLKLAEDPVLAPQRSMLTTVAALSTVMFIGASISALTLLLVRMNGRRAEFITRFALGASRWSIIRDVAVETSLLTGIAGIVGLLVWYWTAASVWRALLGDPNGLLVVADSRVLRLLAALVSVAWLTCMVGAVVQLSTRSQLGFSEFRAQWPPRPPILRHASIAIQLALCIAAVVGASLLVRSVSALLDVGFDFRRVLAVSLDPFGEKVPPAELDGFYGTLAEHLRKLPAVEMVSIVAVLPMRSSLGQSIVIPGSPSVPKLRTGGPYINAVGTEFFRATGVSILLGRSFTRQDTGGTEPVAVVNDTMARTIWPGESAINKCLNYGTTDTPCIRVVGVCQDARRQLVREDPTMQFYIPFSQKLDWMKAGGLVVRTTAGSNATPSDLQAPIQRSSVGGPRLSVEDMWSTVRTQTAPWTAASHAFVAFAIVSSVLAASALYSLVSYNFALRQKEFAVRIAVGASRRHLVSLMLRNTLGATLLGSVLGLGLALMEATMMRVLLYRVSTVDFVSFAVAAVALGFIALTAGIIPAWRLSRLSIVTILRIN